ncbi:MAG: response regulator transcription factor [Spirochaetales bacterium]|nr:response regulator transcription factor [Spirochaetales bacterium]
MNTILIIEDEPGVRMTLEDRLSAEGYGVKSCSDGITGEETAIKGGFSLILLDIMLPGRDGFAVCEKIRKSGSTVPIIMLTARNTDLDTVLGLRQGADDYVAKPFDMAVLLARIEAQIRRSSMSEERTSPSLSSATFGEFILDREKGSLFRRDVEIPFNGQEYRLLDYLLANPDKIISRDTLLDEVWGYDSETSSRTVDVHIARIRQKLGESEIPRHILTIRGRGYKFIF